MCSTIFCVRMWLLELHILIISITDQMKSLHHVYDMGGLVSTYLCLDAVMKVLS